MIFISAHISPLRTHVTRTGGVLLEGAVLEEGVEGRVGQREVVELVPLVFVCIQLVRCVGSRGGGIEREPVNPLPAHEDTKLPLSYSIP